MMYKIFPSQYFFDSNTEANFLEWLLKRTSKFIIAIVALALVYIVYITNVDLNNIGRDLFFRFSFYAKIVSTLLVLFLIVALVSMRAERAHKVFFFSCLILMIIIRVDTFIISSKTGKFTTAAQMINILILMIIPFIKIQYKMLIGFIGITGLLINGLILKINYFPTLFYVLMIYLCLSVIFYKFDLLLRIQYKMLIEEKNRANMDFMTGVFNRNALELFKNEDLNKESSGEQITVGMLDLDYFKKYNDFYGHLDGDKVLKQFAKALQNFGFDKIYRFGGEEFLFIHIGANNEIDLTSICESLENLKIKHEKSDISKYVTASIGIVKANYSKVSADSLNNIIKSADDNLYLAKDRGRNQCVITNYCIE